MTDTLPLVTIGIPTFNRHELLAQAVLSALNQDYPFLEIIISDNASTDNTGNLCRRFCNEDNRVSYVKQDSNIGAAQNFSKILSIASGEYFMWLGDDDWIDPHYVKECMSILSSNPEMSLVSGKPIYYLDEKISHSGKMFDLLEEYWAMRVLRYYSSVTDNGMFYGVMHTEKLRKITVRNSMGSDWHLIANVVSMGKSKMLNSVSIHRAMGGATASYKQIAKTLELPKIQAEFPMATIVIGMWGNILFYGGGFNGKSILTRICLAITISLSFLMKKVKSLIRGMIKL